MKNVARFRGLWVVGIVATLAAMMQPQAARADDVDDEFLASVGEFEIGNGDVQMIANRRDPTTIRVCIDSAPHTVPLKVTFDQHEELVPPGSCSDVTGAKIKLSPGGRLERDIVLVGRWHHVHA